MSVSISSGSYLAFFVEHGPQPCFQSALDMAADVAAGPLAEPLPKELQVLLWPDCYYAGLVGGILVRCCQLAAALLRLMCVLYARSWELVITSANMRVHMLLRKLSRLE